MDEKREKDKDAKERRPRSSTNKKVKKKRFSQDFIKPDTFAHIQHFLVNEQKKGLSQSPRPQASTARSQRSHEGKVLKRERSFSDQEISVIEIRNSLQKYHSFAGMSRKSLASLLERHQITRDQEEENKNETVNKVESKVELRVVERKFSEKKEKVLKLGKPSVVLLHAYWSTKQNISTPNSLLKEVIPLDNFQAPRKWLVYIHIKEVTCQPFTSSFVPYMTAQISFNGGITHTTSQCVSWNPVWNQTFYFTVKDVNTDKILVNVFAARTKSKEGVSVGKFNFETKSLKADHGYQAPRDKWDALHDGQVGPNQNSFIRYIVQLVPSDIEAFADLEKETIRLLPESSSYKEQYGSHISNNKSKFAKIV